MFLERGEGRLYYEVHGEGDPAVVFVHGWMGSGAVWGEQVRRFSASHRVVVLDLTGYGRSAKPHGVTYTPEVWLDDLDAVMARLGVERPILVGWSMGASIGIAYAVTRPHAISRLVLVSGTPLLVAPPEVFEHATPPEAAEQLAAALEQDFSAGARAFVEMMFPEPGTEALKDEMHAITQQTTAAVALESVRNAGSADLRPLLGRVRVPTLVLHGEADAVCPLGAGRCLADGIPDSRMHTFRGKGHVPFQTGVRAFNEHLGRFAAGG